MPMLMKSIIRDVDLKAFDNSNGVIGNGMPLARSKLPVRAYRQVARHTGREDDLILGIQVRIKGLLLSSC